MSGLATPFQRYHEALSRALEALLDAEDIATEDIAPHVGDRASSWLVECGQLEVLRNVAETIVFGLPSRKAWNYGMTHD